jgi:hypothetical protein
MRPWCWELSTISLARRLPAHPEPLLLDRISIMPRVMLGNRRSARIARMGNVFVIGLTIDVITLIGVAAFVIQL